MFRKLYLASEAKHPDTLNDLEIFVGGFKDKKLVYIPTAANGEWYGSWKEGGSIKAVRSLNSNLKIIELENHAKSDLVNLLGQPEILWIAGGMSGYLLYWLHRLGLNQLIPKLLDQGTIYIGSSAGSMACANTQHVATWYPNESDPAAAYLPGLGLTDFEIFPHFRDDQFDQINSLWTKGTLRLLKDGEAITAVGNTITTIGQERLITK